MQYQLCACRYASTVQIRHGAAAGACSSCGIASSVLIFACCVGCSCGCDRTANAAIDPLSKTEMLCYRGTCVPNHGFYHGEATVTASIGKLLSLGSLVLATCKLGQNCLRRYPRASERPARVMRLTGPFCEMFLERLRTNGCIIPGEKRLEGADSCMRSGSSLGVLSATGPACNTGSIR